MKKRLFTCILTVAVAVAMLIPVSAFAGETIAKTPSGLGNNQTLWATSLGSGYTNSPTPPTVVGNYIYTGANGYVYKIDKATGKVLNKCAIGGGFGYAMMPIVSGKDVQNKDCLYATIQDSSYSTHIVKLYTDSLKMCWTSEGFDGQNVCPLELIGHRLYTGTWGDKGTFFCIEDKGDSCATKWSKSDDNGYYWAGAAEVNDYIIFGSDSGLIYSVKPNADKANDDVKFVESKLKEDNSLVIESVPTIYNNNYAFISTTDVTLNRGHRVSTNTGSLYKVNVSSEGKVTVDSKYNFSSSKNNPVVFDNNVFIGTDSGSIYAFNANDISKYLSTVTAPGAVKGEMLIDKDDGSNYQIYATYNSSIGGIYYAKMPSNCNSIITQGTTYIPCNKQYCISPIVADDSGTLYYKNDSGYIMAVKGGADTSAISGFNAVSSGYKSIKLSWNARANVNYYYIYTSAGQYVGKTTSTSYTVNNLKTNKKYSYIVRADLLGNYNTAYTVVRSAKPIPAAPKISTKAGKKKITVKWKKVSGATGYYVYRATKSTGKYKKVKSTTSKSWTNTKLKKGKKYYYKVKAYRKVSSKKVFGTWSNISYKKVK